MLLAALGKNNWFPGVLSTELLESSDHKIVKLQKKKKKKKKAWRCRPPAGSQELQQYSVKQNSRNK